MNNIICKYKIGDFLLSEDSGEIYELTAIGNRKCLVEIMSENGGCHEFERRIERINQYKKINKK
jgi:hypothetical protein